MSNPATRSLRRIGKGPERTRIEKALLQLEKVPLPENLDITELQGRRPWMRFRVGDWRIIFRSLTGKELTLIRVTEDPQVENVGFLIANIEHKSKVERVIRALKSDFQ